MVVSPGPERGRTYLSFVSETHTIWVALQKTAGRKSAVKMQGQGVCTGQCTPVSLAVCEEPHKMDRRKAGSVQYIDLVFTFWRRRSETYLYAKSRQSRGLRDVLCRSVFGPKGNPHTKVQPEAGGAKPDRVIPLLLLSCGVAKRTEKGHRERNIGQSNWEREETVPILVV